MAAVGPPDADQRERGGDAGAGREAGQRSDRRRWRLLGGVAVVLVAVAVGTLVLLGGDDDDGDAGDETAGASNAPTAPPPVGEQLDAEGAELLDLLAAGSARTYHATYTASGDPAVIGSEFSLEVWHHDGQARQDARQVGESGTVETAGFFLADRVEVSCQRIDRGDWTCAEQRAVDEATAYGVLGSVARELEGADVTVTEEEVTGRPARCFAVAAADGEVTVCVSTDGIPLRRTGGGVELLLSELDEDVPDDIFTPPAETAEADDDGDG